MKISDVIDRMYNMEKTALNKAEKVMRSGLLSRDALIKLYKQNAIKNTLDNRINAKMRRVAGNAFPDIQKHKMNLRRYKGISNPDNLPARAVLDPKRIMKNQGHENSKAMNELRRRAGGKENISIKYGPDLLHGQSAMKYNFFDDKISGIDFKLPEKTVRKTSMTPGTEPGPRTAKEIRSAVVMHEMSGEAVSQARQAQALKASGVPISVDSMSMFDIGTHQNPEILINDAKYARRLNPGTQKFWNLIRKDSNTGVRLDKLGLGELSEPQLVQLLRNKAPQADDKAAIDAIRNAKLSTLKPMTEDELRNGLIRLGRHNTRSWSTDDQVKAVADSYVGTPFYTKKKK